MSFLNILMQKGIDNHYCHPNNKTPLTNQDIQFAKYNLLKKLRDGKFFPLDCLGELGVECNCAMCYEDPRYKKIPARPLHRQTK